MTRYFSTLLLSAMFLPASVYAINTATESPVQHSNAASPMAIPAAKHSDIKTLPQDHVTECFRLYTPDRKPGVNCVPDGSTGH